MRNYTKGYLYTNSKSLQTGSDYSLLSSIFAHLHGPVLVVIRKEKRVKATRVGSIFILCQQFWPPNYQHKVTNQIQLPIKCSIFVQVLGCGTEGRCYSMFTRRNSQNFSSSRRGSKGRRGPVLRTRANMHSLDSIYEFVYLFKPRSKLPQKAFPRPKNSRFSRGAYPWTPRSFSRVHPGSTMPSHLATRVDPCLEAGHLARKIDPAIV